MAPSSSVSPARGFTLMTEDLVEKMRTEAQIASAASILRGVNALHLTSDAASALELAREALGEVSRAIQSSNAARVGEVQKAEIRALTRVCRVGGAQPHYWLDEPGRKADDFVRGADKYEFAIPKTCPHHDSRVSPSLREYLKHEP